MQDLISYCYTYFASLVQGNSEPSDYKNILQASIQLIKDKGQLDFNVENELNRIGEIIQQGNEAYIKRLAEQLSDQ